MSTAAPGAPSKSGGMMKWLLAAVVILIIVAIGVYAGTQQQVAAIRTDDMKFLAENKAKPGVVTTA
jgi:FKBP-type peptidyl-prolyl cis-trans isomerase FkpA/FKBP-type peptidyl-prolyl cis-trans isomerase FklB